MAEQNIEIDNDLLFAAICEIVDRIEKCRKSPETTSALSLASDLGMAIGNKFSPGNKYALERVQKALTK